jgi:hypothetical protein
MPASFDKPIFRAILFFIFLPLICFHPFQVSGKDYEIPLMELKSIGNKDFEIPLSTLKKGEKKKSRKQGENSRKESKNTESEEKGPQNSQPEAAKKSSAVEAPQTSTPSTSAPAVTTIQDVETAKSKMTAGDTPKENVQDDKSATGLTGNLPDEFLIIHEPFSFVVGGKPTIINAVVTSSLSTVHTVNCSFRASDKGSSAILQMKKVPGSLYTYTAVLPPLVKNSGTLRYIFIARDSLKRETRSREFAIPLKMTMVVPGWQLDASKEKIVVQIENKGQPFEGFLDVTVEEMNTAIPVK